MNISKRASNVAARSGGLPVADSAKLSSDVFDKSVTKNNWWSNLNPFFLKGYDMPLTLAEQLDKKEIRDSKEQKVPFKINRHVLLILYSVLIVLTNRLFFGWPNLSNLLFRDGAYIWLCPKTADGDYVAPEGLNRYNCDEQNQAVQNMFIIGSSAYYTFSFFNGLIVDHLGSRISMLIGNFVNLLGWIILLLSSENFNGFAFGVICIAGSIDLASFSTLNISALYPSSESVIVNVISGAGSLSTGTMLVLDIIITKLDLRFKTFMLWYICSTVICFIIMTIFIFPRTRFFRQYEFDNYYKDKEQKLEMKTDLGAPSTVANAKEETMPDSSVASEKVKVSSLRKIHDQLDEENNVLKHHTSKDLEAAAFEERVVKRSNVEKDLHDDDGVFDDGDVKEKEKKRHFFKLSNVKDLFHICISLHFIGLWVYGPLNAIYNNFFYNVVENALSRSKNDILGILLPFSFIPCIILGYITNKIGIMFMFCYELFFAYAMYIFTYIPGEAWQWLSVLSNALFAACANGQLWTYIAYTFSSKYHSTLIGFLNLVSGLLSLVRLEFIEWAKTVKYDYTYINMVMILFIVINTFITAYMIFIRKRYGNIVTIGDKVE